ncbi:hypothetical protein B0H67DRAFT_50806 [Lasiosphaeris hirsuta]|uniref:Secreted protein n=1 Tax=Lasiosphaeris hirsuta TaxID=260670 RepID=A0AA40E8G8_9PEZI|nr:hypothetical protein B0H67DRAFT_50806 [Lasiosphaeris hirsuta]
MHHMTLWFARFASLTTRCGSKCVSLSQKVAEHGKMVNLPFPSLKENAAAFRKYPASSSCCIEKHKKTRVVTCQCQCVWELNPYLGRRKKKKPRPPLFAMSRETPPTSCTRLPNLAARLCSVVVETPSNLPCAKKEGEKEQV